jgi:hypothetical protein
MADESRLLEYLRQVMACKERKGFDRKNFALELTKTISLMRLDAFRPAMIEFLAESFTLLAIV